jgi:hyperosmotically inducible periplasmic protein
MLTKSLFIGVGIIIVLGCSQTDTSHDSPAPVRTSATSADNSNINVRDRSSATTTPLDQGESQQDIATTADVRKQVIAAGLSTDAENTKIITRDGKVTLRGPVQNAQEKLRIVQIAATVAGADNVDDQLEIKTVKKE